MVCGMAGVAGVVPLLFVLVAGGWLLGVVVLGGVPPVLVDDVSVVGAGVGLDEVSLGSAWVIDESKSKAEESISFFMGRVPSSSKILDTVK